MPEECLICTDDFEEIAICYVCYQRLLNEIRVLRERVKELESKP
jgi:hypothetical protein